MSVGRRGKKERREDGIVGVWRKRKERYGEMGFWREEDKM